MPSSNANDSSKSRVALHRTKVAAVGSRRVEVTVPTSDAALVKSVAETLRSGGKRAELVRESLKPFVTIGKARSGNALVAFLRASPLAQGDFDASRDRSTGRAVELS